MSQRLLLSTPSSTLLLAFAACGSRQDRPEPHGLDLRVAPLEIQDIDVACYDVRVSGRLEPVWSAGDPSVDADAGDRPLCSDVFGNGPLGDLAYVGACDASDDADTDRDRPGVQNRVTVWFDGLYTGSSRTGLTPLDDWRDPCGAQGCTLAFDCNPNEDTRVAFDFTLMRDARQGFFDVGVSFDDIFCSAKLDCVPELLHRPGGARDLTAVLAFACTSGADTCLYVDQVTLTCDTGTWTIDPTLGPGTIPEDSPVLYGAAVYTGDEAFTAFHKRYWNVALGLDEAAFAAAQDCTLSWSATAAQGTLEDNTTPDGATYPRVVWSRDIIVDGALDCGAHALDEVLAGEDTASVQASYTTPGDPDTYAHSSCVARWMIGDIELVAYDREAGTFSLRDATKVSPGNAIVSSTWTITESDYWFWWGDAAIAHTTPLGGTGNTFTFTSRNGYEGYAGCGVFLGKPVAFPEDSDIEWGDGGSQNLSVSGMFIEQIYHPFPTPIFIRRDGEFTTDEALLQAAISDVLDEVGLPYTAVWPVASFAAGDAVAVIEGLSPRPGQTLFPIPAIWFDLIDPPTPGYPGDDALEVNYLESGSCTTSGTQVADNQMFRVTLTTTDSHGESVQTRALIFNWMLEKGGVFVGGDLTRSGTALTLTARARGILDHVPPGTTFNRLWLDHDADGSPDAESAIGTFTHDYGAPGTYRGVLSADDDPYWGMGFGEIFAGYYVFVP